MNKLDLINSFAEKKILVIGDTILDVHVYGRTVCKCLDAPAIEAEELNTEITFGGAGLVTNNILELGGCVHLFSVIGEDKDGEYYKNFTHPQLSKNLIIDKNRRTTVKKRFVVDGHKMLQINQVDNNDINNDLEKKLMESVELFIEKADSIFVLDAQHGLLTENLIRQLINFGKKYGKPIYVDSQISHRGSRHGIYQGADCLFLNLNEAKAIDSGFDVGSPEKSLEKIKHKLNINNVVVKLGSGGSIALFNDKFIKTPPYVVEAIDTCGAGDAFLAAFSLGNREFPEDSLTIANIWAALSTTIRGTKPPQKEDLIKVCKNLL